MFFAVREVSKKSLWLGGPCTIPCNRNYRGIVKFWYMLIPTYKMFWPQCDKGIRAKIVVVTFLHGTSLLQHLHHWPSHVQCSCYTWSAQHPKIQQSKMLVTCQRSGDLFLFGLIWQYSSNHKTYKKCRFKVIVTYLQQ